MIKFSTNPFLFKIMYINKDRFDTASNISGVIGTAFHNAMEVYYGGSDTLIPTNESEAIEYGLKTGLSFLENYNDGFIKFSKNIENKQKAYDIFTFAFQSYIKENPYKPDIVQSVEKEIVKYVNVEWRAQKLDLPVKLKGRLDKIIIEQGKKKIVDYKTCYSYSDPEKIDGKKIIQAVNYFLLEYAETGEAPYSLIYEEVKYSQNRDGTPQVKRYEIVFEENELYFDFYFRFYEDMTRALNGEMVFLPNIDTLYDNEVGIVSYIHRLDIEEEKASLLIKNKVNNITELLKKEIQNAGNMRKLLQTVEAEFVSAKNLDYDKMNNQEKIATKMMEYGMMLSFDSKVEGTSVDLYRFIPSIGLKMSRVRSYTDDVEQVLGISGIRILAPIPDSNMVGFEVPRKERVFITNTEKNENLIAGLDVLGQKVELIIEEMPHLLVAGSSGSGKSVFLNEVIKQMKNKFEIVVLDPKGVDFVGAGALSEKEEIVESLNFFLKTMDYRYDLMKMGNARKWSETGNRSTLIIIDEYNDLAMSNMKIQTGVKKESKLFAKGEVEMEVPVYDTVGNIVSNAVKKLAQKARSAGIHIILATQRPSVKVIDGDIKANFPTRISFRLPTVTDSKVILDDAGAENLLGKGDGLLLKDGRITRFQSFSN